VFLSPRDGLVWSLFGDEITRKVTGDETGGAYAIVESRVDPGGGPPPHIHHGEEELFYVSEGEFELRWGSELRRGGPGTIALLPRDVPHGFRNVGKTPGRLVTVISPAGFEGFFEEVFALPPADRSDMAKVSAIGAKYRVEFLPLPPPGGSAAPATSAR
jgi:quercetin dioxygenase-like cupin family protein